MKLKLMKFARDSWWVRLRRIFNPLTELREGYETFVAGGGWGNRIEWGYKPLGPRFGEVMGWKWKKPQRGDLFLAPMQSGRLGAFVFTEIRPCADPPDMFWATVERYGYAEEKR